MCCAPVAYCLSMVSMDHTSRNWNVLCWNIRGINDPEKWNSVRNKLEESACSIACLQETKREDFSASYVRNFAPRRFDSFEFSPSIGASGGMLVLWNSSHFTGNALD